MRFPFGIRVTLLHIHRRFFVWIFIPLCFCLGSFIDLANRFFLGIFDFFFQPAPPPLRAPSQVDPTALVLGKFENRTVSTCLGAEDGEAFCYHQHYQHSTARLVAKGSTPRRSHWPPFFCSKSLLGLASTYRGVISWVLICFGGLGHEVEKLDSCGRFTYVCYFFLLGPVLGGMFHWVLMSFS